MKSKFIFNPSKIIVIGLIFLISSCGATKPWYNRENRAWEKADVPPAEELEYSIFLIGDVGEPDLKEMEPSLRLLQKQINGVDSTDSYKGKSQLPDEKKAVVFLGDNIYLDGLSEPDNPEREEEEQKINEQLKIIENWNGQPVFIPGNHDWNYSSEGGLEAVIRQQEYIQQYLKRSNVFLPLNGCPGPTALPLSEDVVLVVLDSEWWLTQHRRPEAPENGCTVATELDLIVQLDDLLDRLHDKHVILAFHHPLMSNGNHGGHYSLGDYIFPLRLKVPNLYIPLPIIGSIYPLARKYGISRQDIPNPKYQLLKEAIFGIVREKKNVVLASGHDHNLQLLQNGGITQILSGSGCKLTHVVRGDEALFVDKEKGFARMNYYKNGEAWVEFWVPEDEGHTGKLVFRMPLYALPEPEEALAEKELPDYRDSVKVIAANSNYDLKGKLWKMIWGDHYREEWRTPIEVPYLDFASEKGGLLPIKKGGGMQTISLRLLDKDSIQYNLRAVDKDPASVLPEPFRTTFAADILKDQISSAHPYAFLAIPDMANAIGVFHTKPELFYVPLTPVLGSYLQEFGGMLAMLEIRPDEDLSSFKQFGYTENAVSTRTMLEHLREDNDDEVNDNAFLKARLFDMILNDWDRHSDQWRWAEYEKEDKGVVYEPIPRDRDQVFSKYDGFLPFLATRKWGMRKFQTFGYDYEDIIGLNNNARHLDRRLLSELTFEDWMHEVAYIKENLTDSVIEKAVRNFPSEIFDTSGEEIIAKLKSRRDKLDKAAAAYYKAINQYVDIVGSDKHELYQITRLEDGRTRVQVYKTKKEGEVKQEIFDRTFDPEITKEIRIYSLGGVDRYKVEGKAAKAIKVRIIGGDEEDLYEDNSDVTSIRRTVVFYDEKHKENEIKAGEETKVRLTDEEDVYKYTFENYEYPYFGPRISLEYNVDDGLFVGGGVSFKKYNFRHFPYASQHNIIANYAFNTGAYNFRYDGSFYSLLGRKTDLNLNLDVLGPQYVFNYFGQGNETENVFDIDYYRVRLTKVDANIAINKNLGEFFDVGIGPRYQYVSLEQNNNTIIDSDNFQQSDRFTSTAQIGGVRFYANLEALNSSLAPTRGIKMFNEFNYFKGIDGENINMLQWKPDFILYVTPNLPGKFNPTMALRIGGQVNVGDFLFYQSATLGNQSNLRGYRRTRFSGKSSFYQNLEVRFPVSKIRSYVLTGNWGVYGFYDQGRVWADNKSSKKWHKGYGPGIYLNLYEFFVVTGSVGFSEEGPYFLVNSGFFF